MFGGVGRLLLRRGAGQAKDYGCWDVAVPSADKSTLTRGPSQLWKQKEKLQVLPPKLLTLAQLLGDSSSHVDDLFETAASTRCRSRLAAEHPMLPFVRVVPDAMVSGRAHPETLGDTAALCDVPALFADVLIAARHSAMFRVVWLDIRPTRVVRGKVYSAKPLATSLSPEQLLLAKALQTCVDTDRHQMDRLIKARLRGHPACHPWRPTLKGYWVPPEFTLPSVIDPHRKGHRGEADAAAQKANVSPRCLERFLKGIQQPWTDLTCFRIATRHDSFALTAPSWQGMARESLRKFRATPRTTRVRLIRYVRQHAVALQRALLKERRRHAIALVSKVFLSRRRHNAFISFLRYYLAVDRHRGNVTWQRRDVVLAWKSLTAEQRKWFAVHRANRLPSRRTSLWNRFRRAHKRDVELALGVPGAKAHTVLVARWRGMTPAARLGYADTSHMSMFPLVKTTGGAASGLSAASATGGLSVPRSLPRDDEE